MKKVVIFYPHIEEYGGIERNILALAEEIHHKGYKPILLCYYDDIDMTKYFNKLEIALIEDHWNPFIKGIRLRNWLRRNRKEIKGIPLFFGAKAGFYAALAKLNFYALHYTDPPSLLGLNKPVLGIRKIISVPRRYVSEWLIGEGVRRAKLCLTMTRRNAEELKSIYSRSFEVVLQGGLPPSGDVNSTRRCSGNVLRIFSICRINSSKNLEWILSTARYLKSSPLFTSGFRKMEVVIAGTGPHLDDLQKKTSELGIGDCVQFPGFLNAVEVEEEYSKSDLFLVPGRQGYGLPVLEALYRHVPVVLNVESRISEIFNAHPWAAVSDNSADSFQQTVLSHISQLRRNYPDADLLNALPNERRWANEIAQYCKWW